MKISIVTPCFNSESTIHDCLGSVSRQTHSDIEHIIIDGGSRDNTVRIAKDSPRVTRVVSEPDNGLYDAMNKGIQFASGEIVGILNSDDFYAHDRVLETVERVFQDDDVDATIADVAFVKLQDLQTTVRYCSAKRWNPSMFRLGIMPPHPGFFVRRRFYETLGLYRTDYRIAADFELLVRFFAGARLRYRYIPDALVFMRPGGASNASWKSRLVLNQEILRACRENGIRTNPWMLASRYIWKVWEFIPSLGG